MWTPPPNRNVVVVVGTNDHDDVRFVEKKVRNAG
jgi:hypothetical protein